MSKTHATLKRLAPMGAVLACFAFLSGCSGGDNGFTNNDNCDYIMAVGIGGGEQDLTTDRQCPSALALTLECTAEFRAPGEPAPNERSQFYIAYYDVTYRNNLTQGTTPGVDVPSPIRVPTATVVDPGDTASFDGWPIIEAGQKLNSPLNDAAFYPPGGVPMTATLTWWGWPLTDPDAKCFQTMTWEFTIYTTGPLPTDPQDLDDFFTSCD